LFFGNCTSFREILYKYLEQPDRIRKGLILDVSTISFIDASGAHMLVDVVNHFRERGFSLFFRSFNVKSTNKLRSCGILATESTPGIIQDHQLYVSVEDARKVALTTFGDNRTQSSGVKTLETENSSDDLVTDMDISCWDRCLRKSYLRHGEKSKPLIGEDP